MPLIHRIRKLRDSNYLLLTWLMVGEPFYRLKTAIHMKKNWKKNVSLHELEESKQQGFTRNIRDIPGSILVLRFGAIFGKCLLNTHHKNFQSNLIFNHVETRSF